MTFTLAQAKKLLPERPRDSHKGDFGHVLIVAGSPGMGGAAALAGLGALRSGVGLVTVAVPASRQSVVAAVVPEAMTVGLLETRGSIGYGSVPAIRKLLHERKITAAGIGPGLTVAPAVAVTLQSLLPSLKGVPLVLDADGLNCLAGAAVNPLRGRTVPAVLTPHPGEAARLLKTTTAAVQADRAGAAARIADKYKAVCLLKGHGTLVSDGKKSSVNPTGNPGMAKGGMGDVLTGLIGGLLAQGLAPYDAARLGAYVHGLAGDIAVKETGEAALLPRDLAAALPRAFKKLS